MKKKFAFKQFYGGQRAGAPIWLTIYGDMMTNLMLFFMMLWALTRMTFEAQKAAQQSLQRTITKKEIIIPHQEKEKKTVVPEKPKFTELLKIKSDIQGIRVIFDSPVLFKLGSAELSSDTKSLDELANWLLDVPYTVIVEGHTDNTPIKKGLRYSSNWELSLDRARSVVRYFRRYGIDPKRLVLAGYGEHHPICENDTQKHRALNRRIEIYVLYREK